MFAIAKTEKAVGLQPIQTAAPQAPGPLDVQIAVKAAGICGTDLHIFNWDKWAQANVTPTRVLGHEFMGEVVAVGAQVSQFTKGQRVSGECHIVCGHCRSCRTGDGHLCPETQIIGVHRDGAYTERFNMPAMNLWPVADDIPDNHAAIFDPLGNAMHTVDRAQVSGKNVLVVGAGTIGLASIAMAKTLGANRVLVLEPNARKRQIAKEMGADDVFDSTQAERLQHVQAACGSGSVDVVLEMSGHPAGVADAFAAVRPGGCVTMLGLPSKEMPFDFATQVIMRGVDIRGVTGRRMFETWYQVDAFQKARPDIVEKLISHVLPATQFEEGFRLFAAGESTKVVLSFA